MSMTVYKYIDKSYYFIKSLCATFFLELSSRILLCYKYVLHKNSIHRRRQLYKMKRITLIDSRHTEFCVYYINDIKCNSYLLRFPLLSENSFIKI